jgi:hypothetical protein
MRTFVAILFACTLAACSSTPVAANRAVAETNRHVAAARADGKQVARLGGTLGRANEDLRNNADRIGAGLRRFRDILNAIRPAPQRP